ncbi:hypothetical protein EV363DRAFT_1328807 [Boletus edulis]|nr:hypothetical protein EV363DRAFT_1328807 [Boletus edulis]
MLFFICSLAIDANNAKISSDLHHLMSTKILRRLSKLGPSTPGWLSDMALRTCGCLQDTLEVRWASERATKSPPPPWNPSQLDLTKDTYLSLLHSHEYLHNALAGPAHKPGRTPFRFKDHVRGTLEDFLSSNGTFFEEAYRSGPYICLFDVERSVEQGIDDWVASITDVFQACAQLETLMDKYLSSAHHMDRFVTYDATPEHRSIMLLTALELWVALDQLVVKEIPILADYSPEVPTVFLERLLLRKSMNFQRLSRAYWYLSSRHSQSHLGWSVLSDEFTEDSFPLRYYECSPNLQHLKAHIEAEAIQASTIRAYRTNIDPDVGYLPEGHLDNDRMETFKSILPSEPLHAKVFVFELQCPVLVRIWRSATTRLLYHFVPRSDEGWPRYKDDGSFVLLSDIPELQPYLAEHLRQKSPVKAQFHFAYLYSGGPQSRNGARLCYTFEWRFQDKHRHNEGFCEWRRHPASGHRRHKFPNTLFAFGISVNCAADSYDNMNAYIQDMTHISNKVLSTQTDCPEDYSLHEYNVFGHLRSGGSLQWTNILRELRNRALNIHRVDFHYLLAQAASQIGPLDLTTGGLMWHQELQEPSFCHALLEELESLFDDLAASLLDGVAMNTISFLATRLLASSPCEDVSEQAIRLLRNVRKKTFRWVKELSYNLIQDPMSHERRKLLQDMAATCRSTCDVDPTTLRKIILSAEDVEALLACSIFIQATSPTNPAFLSSRYSRVVVERDRRLAPVLEVVLRDAILADVSDRGIDLAVGNIWPGYRPGDCRWEPLPDLNSHRLTCQTAETGNGRSQTVHVDLLDGSLLVDGQPLGGLPPELRDHPVYLQIFKSETFIVIPSSLPGMDFATLGTVSEHYVHFSLRGEDLVIQAQPKHAGDIILELIPQEKLKGDLPTILVENHIHWLNISTSTIEIRPLGSLWKHSPDNWEVNCVPGEYRVHKDHTFLADFQSQTWEMVSSRLGCIELPGNLIVSASTSGYSPVPQLSVTLPRYGLSFFVNEDEDLESRDFKEMVYDKDQCVGALFRLADQLVLRPKVQVEGLVHRCVLIPHNLLSLHDNPISNPNNFLKPVQYHAYKVDTDLGCLTENGCLKSKVYLAGLHELTSIDWSPDPLTGKTGTQEALCLLQSAGCQSRPGWDLLGHHSSYYIGSGCIRYKHDGHPQIDVASQGLPRSRWPAYQPLEEGPGHIAQLKRGATRGAYLSPSNINAGGSHLIPLGECILDRDYVYSDVELEDTVYTAASTVYNRRVDVPITDMLLRWDSALFDATRAETMTPSPSSSSSSSSSSSQSSSPHDLPRLVTIEAQAREILRENETACQRFGPLFLLPTLAYCSPFPHIALLSLRTAFAEQSLRENPRFPPKPQPTSPACEVVPPRYAETFERKPCQWRITLDQLLHSRTAPELPPRSTDSLLSFSNPVGSWDPSLDISALHRLFTPLQMQTDPPFRQEYISRLRISAQHARSEAYVTHEGIENSLIEALKQRFAQCRGKYMRSLDILKEHLGPTTVPLERALDRSGQWPRITADTLLQCLASTSPIKLSTSWKKWLVSLALLLLDLQHARRLLRFALDGLEEEFYKELGNEGCNEWCAEIYPDWLLIQIQGDFRIRSIQAEIATEMISPQSGENTVMKNTVMQVNMGEGKSSVIVPISAAALADGHQLVRVIVPKALAAQMFDTLVRCLGGLAGRKIYCLPFSRGNFGHLPPFDGGNEGHEMDQMDQIYEQMSQCMNDRGILVVQPEHILSLKLASVEKQLSESKAVAERSLNSQKSIYERAMTFMTFKSLTKGSYAANVCRSFGSSFNRPSQNPIKNDGHDGNTLGLSGAASKSLELQQWLHSHARDILDESDDILHTRWQLIYTIGIQERVDGYPDRWTITQQVLRLVRKHMSSLANDVPDAMEYERGPPGSFPHVRILQGSNAGQLLISSVVEDVMAGRLRSFRFQYTDPALQLAIRNFISREHAGPEEVKEVQTYVQQSQQSGLLEGLLLLRGLLASNILLFAFYYGLLSQPTSRTRGLAVPYRAKDVPAHDTQFGHPDITILFTCLSYYYSGLEKEELKTAFEIMLDQDDPASEFAMWIEGCEPGSVSDSLQKLGDINLQSSEQWDKHLFPLLSCNQGAIDFYLSRVVFPKEAKEFPWKLSGSSWDLAEKRECPITGFSGTADGRYLLPMSISHRDLDHQQGTNARVLACLLQSDNDFYRLTTKENGERCTTQELLEIVVTQTPEIRVLLDVGAQILDLSNREVAEFWLHLTPDADGAIHFDPNDELMVLTKNGTTVPLISSPLSQQLDRCVAYLDHAHTRGTDIKFPKGFRAAVTLGPKVTKDHLVQGCMRMRKLGYGHSTMFFAPPEVDRNIRFVAAKEDENIRVTTADILHWAIRETWTDIQQRAYHWAQQGMNYRSRYDAWSRFCKNELSPEKMAEAWLQPEYKSLADLYSPCDTRNTSNSLPAMDLDIRNRCIYLGGVNSSFRKVSLDEEQERQVSRQLEREREVELAPKAEPAEHSLHPDVEAFVTTGYLPSSLNSTAFHPVFTTLEKSSAASREAQVWSPFILATEDFCRTIKPESTRGRMDQYLRPVQWVLSGFKGRDRVLVLLSPFEADRLMPAIRISKHVHLHVYLPRTTEQMKPSDDLKFYVIPPLPDDWTPPWDLIDQLNVFAGQLYLRDYESYLRLSQFLGITPTGTATATKRNLFIPGALEELENTFVDSPLPCIMTLLTIRRRGLPFMETHMGKILQGRTLTAEDFKKPPTVASGHSLKRVADAHDATSHREARRSPKRRLEDAEGSEFLSN